MKTETNREMAERTIREWVEHGLDEHYEPNAEFPITMPPDDLIERFEAALNAERERCAKILDARADQLQAEWDAPPCAENGFIALIADTLP